MTQKDFKLIAKVIRDRVDNLTENPNAKQELNNIAFDFAKVLSEENPRFDADKFLEAAGF